MSERVCYKMSDKLNLNNLNRCFIIAEIGQNHQGDIALAKKLIQIAKECGADCAKFQKTDLNEKFTKAALERQYSSKNSFGPTYGEHKKFLEFTKNQFEELKNYADEIGILFSASAMDMKSLDYLLTLNLPFVKIGSGDANNFSLIEKAASTKVPLIISTVLTNLTTVMRPSSLSLANEVIVENSNDSLERPPPQFPRAIATNLVSAIKLDTGEIVILRYSKNSTGVVSGSPTTKKSTLAGVTSGMQEFETVKKIHATVSKYHKNFGLLHCISAYPTPYKEINLNVIKLYQHEFPDIIIGYSGHELGIHFSTAAVALGSKIIERHITTDKKLKGSDHNCSLEPEEFATLVNNIRSLEKALGSPQKTMQKCELPCYEKLGKTIVFSKNLSKGHKLCITDLNVKVAEPKGIDGSHLEDFIGKILVRDVKENNSLQINDII